MPAARAAIPKRKRGQFRTKKERAAFVKGIYQLMIEENRDNPRLAKFFPGNGYGGTKAKKRQGRNPQTGHVIRIKARTKKKAKQRGDADLAFRTLAKLYSF